MDFAKLLEGAGLSQMQLARACGVTKGQVGHWVKGRQRITAERAVQIEQVTGGRIPRTKLRPDLFGTAA